MSRESRRRFLGTLTSTLGLGMLGAEWSPLEAWAPWDLAWLDRLKGKHRQVFDLGGRNPTTGNPLRVPRNWLNAHREVFGLSGTQLSTCVGITSESFPLNAGDALWEEYPIGEHFEIKDPATGQWARRNLWLEDRMPLTRDGANVRALQARGTIFWQCNNALNGVVQQLVDRYRLDREKTRNELIAGLNPGVKFVPAHTMVLGLAQERGFTYEKV